MLAAGPKVHTLTGLDKPKKEQRGTLGNSELAEGKVTIHCRDMGAMVIVEVNDPGIKGARDVWVEKKAGDAMPPCDESDRGRTHLSAAEGFGNVAGAKGDFVFVTSSDGFGDRMALRVFQLSSGNQLFETELSTQQPITLTVEGKALWLRFHRAVPLTCEPHGETAAQCWKELRESARVPEELEVNPPPCDAIFKGKPSHLSGTPLVALPAEIDLTAPKSLRFRAGAATCAESP
jgi:hypothetical protein